MSVGIDLTNRDAYDFWHREQIRFSDTDMLGHVNNVAYVAIIESGRVAFARSGLLGPLTKKFVFVMARIEIDYRAEVHYPADILVGTCLISIGRSSIVLGTGVFTSSFCAATSLTTLVQIDTETRRATPIGKNLRVVMEALLPAAPRAQT